MTDRDRQALVDNFVGHMKGIKKREVAERQRTSNHLYFMLYLNINILSIYLVSVFAAVSKDLGDRVAKGLGLSPVAPLKAKSASEVSGFKVNA